MTLDDQVTFLTNLGDRLDRLCSPGDSEDYISAADKTKPLWTEFAKQSLPVPSSVCDILMARWMVVKDYQNQMPVSMRPNPAQLNFSRTRSGKDIVLKAGRAGFTTMELCRALLKVSTKRGYTGLLVTYDSPAAQLYFIQSRFTFDRMAGKFGAELRQGAWKTDKKNVREIYFPALNSHLYVESAGSFAPAEGDSIQYLICDEMARWLKGDPTQTVATLLSHVTGENAEIIMMSRPFGQSGEFFERFQSARRGESTYKAHFYQWWWNPGQRMRHSDAFVPNAEEIAISKRYEQWIKEEAPKDCGLPAALPNGKLQWRRAQRSELRDLFVQEFAEDEHACFLGSGNCPFDGIAIDRVLNDTTPVLERQSGVGEAENGLLRWLDPLDDSWYVLFIDPAGTLYTSRIAMVLIHGPSGEQAAEWVGRCDVHTATAIALDLVEKFHGRVIIVVELNMGIVSADMIGDFRAAGITTDADTWPHLYHEQDSGGQWRSGWKTDEKTRPVMLETFAKVLQEEPHLFHSKRLIGEVKACIRNGDRIEHGKGMTDDIVMAAAGAHKVRLKQRIVPREPWFEVVTGGPERKDEERNWHRIR